MQEVMSQPHFTFGLGFALGFAVAYFVQWFWPRLLHQWQWFLGLIVCLACATGSFYILYYRGETDQRILTVITLVSLCVFLGISLMAAQRFIKLEIKEINDKKAEARAACVACGANISVKAQSCPHCGHLPMPTREPDAYGNLRDSKGKIVMTAEKVRIEKERNEKERNEKDKAAAARIEKTTS